MIHAKKHILPLSIALALGAGGAAPVLAAEKYAEGGIYGTIEIDFDSRKNPASDGQPQVGITDKYKVDLNVGADTAFKGQITRTPQVAGTIGIKQEAELDYNLDLVVFNPSNRAQTMDVGRWTGEVPISSEGVYQLDKEAGADMRFIITMKGGADSGPFGGEIQGRKLGGAKWLEMAKGVTETIKSEGASQVFTRMYQGKPISVKATNVDPMKFRNVVLPAGPASMYGAVTVNGDMIYDYDSDTWFIDDMSFRYTLDGKSVKDEVSGTIRWKDAETGDGGSYDLNVTFNEPKAADTPQDASGFFDASDSSAGGFFSVDDAVATCGGAVVFDDKYIGDDDAPIHSLVTHKIQCNDKVAPQQTMAFAKLWLLSVGPLNDE